MKMNCREIRQLLEPFADGELDLVRHMQLEEHLAGCTTCAGQLTNLQSLRSTIAAPSLYHVAPSALRERMTQSPALLAPKTEPRSAVRSPRSTAMMVASLLVVAGASFSTGILASRSGASADDQLIANVVTDHVRSIQVDHLMDVASTDRHTVKPWFQGKLDFAPQVPDLSEQDFVLSGGRLDVLADHVVAALVYHRRLHVINVLVRPSSEPDSREERILLRQGFHLRNWVQAGMSYWAVSDLNDEELDEFVTQFRRAVGPEKS